jgi:signal transduction histidine kinase
MQVVAPGLRPFKVSLSGKENKKYRKCSADGLNFLHSGLFLAAFLATFADQRHLDCPMSSKPLKSFILCCLVVTGGNSVAQSPASAVQRLSVLLRLYHDHRLGDTAYLKAVDSVAPLMPGIDDSLPQRLDTYREIAFGDKKWGIYRAHYYTYLTLYYYTRNMLGSSMYYSEKNNEERIKTGEFQKEGLSHSDLFAITIYSNNRDYARVLSRYKTLRPALLRLPGGIRAGTVSPDEAAVGFMIGNAVVYAACKAKDSSQAIEAAGTGDKMLTAIRQSPAKYGTRMAQYTYLCHLSDFEKERFLGHFGAADGLLQDAIGEVRARGFPPGLQPAYTEFTYTEAFDFYFDQDKIDSARHYLALVKALNEKGVDYSSLDPEFLPESNSKLLARDGHFKEAYEELLREYRIRDSAFYAVSSDKDNNLYALAAEENTRAELLRMEAGRQKAERFTLYLFSLLGLLAACGLAGFLAYRSRQRQRLLNLQLNLARNFHDEIGPMLLFANALVKKELEIRPSVGLAELKVQTAQIMEAVRGISHDLKSNQLSTVDSFSKEMMALLVKLKSTTGIDFIFRINNGSRILSYRQYTHLAKMMNELIGNSIKHAGCSRIIVGIKSKERHLSITYSDDGSGIEPGSFSAGIGLQNIRERTALLKGSFQLHNSWPEGYSIELLIPLV